MKLIEQLGGYEWAKIIQGSREMGGLPDDLDLEDALLEYRRQHNIFEVGDWIVHIFHKDSKAQKIKGVDGNYIYVFSHDESYHYKAYSPDFRHATDAEIKAGKRLEVNQ